MRNRGKLRKLVWLLLIAVFAAIAGGGCGGSSSGNGGGDDDGGSNVTEIDRADHPLAFELRKLYHKMPEGTIFISEKRRANALSEEEKDRIKAAYEAGRIVGMFAPTRSQIEELYDVLGVDIFGSPDAPRAAAAADEEEPQSEFYMITLRNGALF